MRDPGNFDGAECEALEGEIRAMCDKLKLVAPPSEYSLEDAIQKVISEGTNPVVTAAVPAFAAIVVGFCRSWSAVFTAQRLSNVASSVIVFVMLMIIPLALFSNSGMAMNAGSAQAHGLDRKTPVNDEDLKLECTKYLCGDKRYEK